MQPGNLAGLALAAPLLFLSACDARRPEAAIPGASPRLVLFGPALTAMAFELGLGGHVAGVDRESRPPPGEERPVVGSAFSVRVEPILAAKPDILAVTMSPALFEPVKLADPRIRIEHFEFRSLEDVARAMERLGRLVGKEDLGVRGARAFREKLDRVRRETEGLPRPGVLFVIGCEEPLAVGREDFVDELVAIAGGRNVLAARHAGWKRLPLEAVLETAPDVILCQAPPAYRETARAYWESAGALGGRSPPPSVEVLEDPRWTVPAGHLAVLAEDLARRLHPGGRAAGREP